MIKNSLFASILSIALVQMIQAQSLPTGFEEWSQTTIEQLPALDDFWFSNNFEADSFMYGGGPVKQTTDSYTGDYAIRLETIIDSDNDTVPGYLGIVPRVWNSGRPFTGNPDSLIGFFKCNIMPNDTADIYVGLSREGEWEGYGHILFSETDNTSEYKRFAMKIDTNSNGLSPDSLQIVLGSAMDWGNAVPGTWIQFDSLYFIGANLKLEDTLGNSDFERWAEPNIFSYEDPTNWMTTNNSSELFGDTSFIFKSDDAHSGDYSLSMVSDTIPGQSMEGGEPINMVFNGSYTGDAPGGGFITNHWPDSIVAYCKYLPEGNDSAIFAVIDGNTDLSKEMPTPENSVMKKLSETATFQKVVIDMSSIETDPSDPDTVLVIISSSNILSGSYEIGSQLWVDDIELYPQTVQFIELSADKDETEIYVDSVLQFSAEVFPNYALNDTIAWRVDDESVATIDQNGLLTGVGEGTVTITAAASDGSSVESTINISVLANETETNALTTNPVVSLLVYPIPAESAVHIASEFPVSGTIKVIDFSGKALIETTVSETQLLTLDVAELPAGIYFIQMNLNENLSIQKILIQ